MCSASAAADSFTRWALAWASSSVSDFFASAPEMRESRAALASVTSS